MSEFTAMIYKYIYCSQKDYEGDPAGSIVAMAVSTVS